MMRLRGNRLQMDSVQRGQSGMRLGIRSRRTVCDLRWRRFGLSRCLLLSTCLGVACMRLCAKAIGGFRDPRLGSIETPHLLDAVDARSDNGNAHHSIETLIEGCAEDDIGVFIDFLA